MLAKEMIRLGITARKTGEILGIPVSTLYYQSAKADKDKALTEFIEEIAFKHTFYGYRRIHLAIKRRGISVNRKRVYRIYKTLALQRQRPRRKKKMPVVQLPLTKPLYCNHVWAVDFLFDTLTDGRRIKIMTVEDLFSRLSPCINVRFSIPAKAVIEVFEECIQRYGIPRIIRTDQGPEFRSLTFQKFIQKYGIRHEFTEKGSPWQNGNLESFNGKLREECLSRNLFESPSQAKEVIEKYRIFYNTERPHSGLNGKTPYEVYKNSL